MTVGSVAETAMSDQPCWLAKACNVLLQLAWPTVDSACPLLSIPRGKLCSAGCALLPASYDKTARILVNVVVFYTSSIACCEWAMETTWGTMKRMNAHAHIEAGHAVPELSALMRTGPLLHFCAVCPAIPKS